MRSHLSTAATYLKYFSSDLSKGRKSLINVFNKKTQLKQTLPVKEIGMKRGAFSIEVEKFFDEEFEKYYDKFMDIISTRYPPSIQKERLKYGTMMVINLILRNRENYKEIQRIYKNYPAIVKKYGDNPWHSVEEISDLMSDIMTRRPFPIVIRGFPNDVFITCDNPIIILRQDFGTVYLLPIKRTHAFCLGYYISEEHLKYMEIYINKFEIIPEKINALIRHQAETHYVI